MEGFPFLSRELISFLVANAMLEMLGAGNTVLIFIPWNTWGLSCCREIISVLPGKIQGDNSRWGLRCWRVLHVVSRRILRARWFICLEMVRDIRCLGLRYQDIKVPVWARSYLMIANKMFICYHSKCLVNLVFLTCLSMLMHLCKWIFASLYISFHVFLYVCVNI